MASEWIALILGLIAILGAIYSGIRFLVRSIMRELLPNGGTSLRDQVNRIETRLDTLVSTLLND
jgi:hypothetical protein